MKITRRQAEAVLAKLVKRYDADINGITFPADGDCPELVCAGLAEIDHPKLRERGDNWEIVWEAGPYEWAYRASMGGYDEETAPVVRAFGGTPKSEEPLAVSAKVFLEPVNTYTLGVYPA